MGRPKGSLNKKTLAKAAFVEATTAGGVLVQSKTLCLVTNEEIAQHGGIYGATLAKAVQLAADLQIKTALAWKMLADERVAILPYLEAKPSPIKPKDDDRANVAGTSDWSYGTTDESQQYQGLSAFDVDALTQDASHMGEQTLTDQGLLPFGPAV